MKKPSLKKLLIFQVELSSPTFAIVSRVLRIWESFFYSQAFSTLRRFLPCTPSQHLEQPAFIKASLGAGSSSLKVAECLTEVRNTDSAHLFVWITQCSVKVLVGRFYICVRALWNTMSTSSSSIYCKAHVISTRPQKFLMISAL